MGRSWTNEQLSAIDARGASIIVSAAAGSGKTTVLVERVTRLLADTVHPCPADQLVVVTFTKDAAAEVRSRLNIALSESLKQHPDDPWLRQQLVMLQSAKISTIHSFCFDLLREQFAALDISASFRVMDADEEDALRTAIAGETLEAFAKQAAEHENIRKDQQLLFDAFCTKDDTPLESLLLSLYQKTEDTPFGGNLLAEAAAAYQDGSMLKKCLGVLQEELDEIRMLYEKAIALCIGVAGNEKPLQTLQEELDVIETMERALADGDCKRLSSCIRSKIKTQLRPNKKFPADRFAMVKAVRGRAKDMRDKLINKWCAPLDFAEADCRRQGDILRVLDLLMREFVTRLKAEKLARNAIGFGDAMTLTLSLVAEKQADGKIIRTPLAESLSKQYACIMIDEFQDADDQQDLIFRMLSKGGDAEHYGSNLFVVGDSKQCIYRFRNANPGNFYRAMQAAADYHTPMLTDNTRILLNKNFRSAGEVVDLVNEVFGRLMTLETGGITYDDTQKLVQGASYNTDIDRPAELLLINQKNKEELAEVNAVADRIARHLALGTPVRESDTTMRPCRPSDFMLLLRKGTDIALYADALKARGIPVCQTAQTGYLKSPEILMLLDLLRAVDNPLLDIPLAGAMLAPLHGFTLDDLVEIRLCDRKASLYQALQKLLKGEQSEEARPSDALIEKCRKFVDFLESMRLCSAMETPEQLIRRIYQQTDFLGMMQMTDGGAQKKANLRALLTHAHNFEENNGGGLSAFLRYLDAVLERGSDLEGGGIPIGTEDVVSIKTIHGSKGLESPFVVLVNTQVAHFGKDVQEVYQYHADFGFGFRLYDPETYSKGASLSYQAILKANRKEARSEELRLLYVALTRAKERLILPITHKDGYATTLKDWAAEQDAFGGQTDSLTRHAENMRDWLMMALMRNPAAEHLRREFELDCGTLPHAAFLSLCAERIEPDTPNRQPDAHPEGVQPPADEQLVAQMKAQCQWQYDSPEANLTAKYGVSELAKEEDFSAPLRRPLFVREQHGLSGAERGTAVHTFMQYADFAAASHDLAGEITALRQRGRLTEKQAAAVEKSGIEAFFRTPLYERLQKADQVWREKKFTVRLSDLQLAGNLAPLREKYEGTKGMLIGIMDLVFAEDDGLVLVDYKTDHVSDPALLLERYTEQLRLYAEALQLLMALPVKECCLYSLHLNRVIPVKL